MQQQALAPMESTHAQVREQAQAHQPASPWTLPKQERPQQLLLEPQQLASRAQPERSPSSDSLAFELHPAPSRTVYTQLSFEPLDRIYQHRLRLIFRQIDPTATPP